MEIMQSLINNMGFPIAVSLAAFYGLYKMLLFYREDMRKQQELHDTEIDNLRKTMDENHKMTMAALNSNTEAMNAMRMVVQANTDAINRLKEDKA